MKSLEEQVTEARARGGLESAIKEESEELPPIAPLNVNAVDGRGKRYQGRFIFKVPNLRDQILIGEMKTRLLPNGGVADPNSIALAEMLAYLAVTLQEPKPKWWEPELFYDAAPVVALYQEAIAYAKRFLGETSADGEGESAGSAGEEGSDEAGAADVGRKVRPPAQRREVVVAHGEGSADPDR